MNKSDLIKSVAMCSGLTQAQAQRAINCYHECVKSSLASGNSVSLTGFGTFSVAERSARPGINPATQQPIEIAAKRVAKFKASKDLSNFIE